MALPLALIVSPGLPLVISASSQEELGTKPELVKTHWHPPGPLTTMTFRAK